MHTVAFEGGVRVPRYTSDHLREFGVLGNTVVVLNPALIGRCRTRCQMSIVFDKVAMGEGGERMHAPRAAHDWRGARSATRQLPSVAWERRVGLDFSKVRNDAARAAALRRCGRRALIYNKHT